MLPSVVHPASLEALLQAFAALGSVVGVISAYAGFLSLICGDDPDEIGASLSIGAAIGFAPGLLVAAFVYQQVASNYAIELLSQ